jgi:uncharacterized protein YcnI
VKHDGWRAQLHKAGDVVTIYSRNGNDVTQRFKSVAEAVAKLPAHSVIMDAEIIACDADGVPDFYALMHRAPHGCCAYCFDLLELDGTAWASGEAIPAAPTAQAGWFSKLRDDRYRSGKNPGWIKVKTAAWRAANKDRWEKFQKEAIEPSAAQPPRRDGRSRLGDDQRKTAMAMLHRFTLMRNKTEGGWELKDKTGDVIGTFGTKAEALAGGKLEKLLGKQGGTVRVHKQDGKFAEERTFPRSRDPRSSPG